MRKIIDPFIDNLPTIDLHGESREYAVFKSNEFIEDNYILKNNKIVIIHGKGSGILKNAVKQLLKNNKYVESYEHSVYNLGITIVTLKKH